MHTQEFFKLAWETYTNTSPQAAHIHNLIRCEGEQVINDHIAYRTLSHSHINMEKIINYFKDHGYKQKGDYHFETKKLSAVHLEHPRQYPKIFISEYDINNLTPDSQDICHEFLEEVTSFSLSDLLLQKRNWSLSFENYQKLKEESEYVSWVASLGLIPNHFTIAVNQLKRFNTLEKIIEFLKVHKIEFNQVGGEIKGTEKAYLRQASTLAEKRKIMFSDGEYEIPTCYYEFAQRFKINTGEYFQGFLENSADKIFESTYEK